MATDCNDLKRAVHSIMNDVVEQCFHHLIYHPEYAEPLNQIIREASEEINYQCLKVDAHSHRRNSSAAEEHYKTISRDVHKKSLEMLSRLQRIQRETRLNAGGGQPGDSSSLSQSF